MKITRLKRGYRINLSDAEYQLYLTFVQYGSASLSDDVGDLQESGIKLERDDHKLFAKINGTFMLSDWSSVHEDRR